MWTFDSLSLLYKELKKKVESIIVPSKLSQLQNDMGFSDRLSELTNDAGFITAAQAPVQSVNGKTGAVNTRAYDFSFAGTSDFAAQVDTALATHGAGSYTFVITNGADNDMPSNTYWYGIIQCTSANFAQVICWGNTNAAEAPTYRRTKSSGTWSGWVRVQAPGPVYSAVSSSTVSVASATDTVIKEVTLDPGIYIFSFGANFAANANGYRAIAIAAGTILSNAAYPAAMRIPAVTTENTGTWVTCTTTFQLTAQTTYHCIVRQNSGSALSVAGAYRYVKLA